MKSKKFYYQPFCKDSLITSQNQKHILLNVRGWMVVAAGRTAEALVPKRIRARRHLIPTRDINVGSKEQCPRIRDGENEELGLGLAPLDGDGGVGVGELAIDGSSTTSAAEEVLAYHDGEVVAPPFSFAAAAAGVAVDVVVVAPGAGAGRGGSASLTRRARGGRRVRALGSHQGLGGTRRRRRRRGNEVKGGSFTG